METQQQGNDGTVQPACPLSGMRHYDQFIVIGLIGVTLVSLLYVLLVVSDTLMTDPLGGPVVGSISFDKQSYGQTIGQITTSIADSDIHITLGLFLAVGFALSRDSEHKNSFLFWKMWPLCGFCLSAILSIFFAIKLKTGLLYQLQYDRINIDLLEPVFRAHLLCLLIAALFCFAVLLLCLGSFARERRG